MNREEKYQFIVNNIQAREKLEQFIADNVDTSIEEVNDVIEAAFDETSPNEFTLGIFRKDKFAAYVTRMRYIVYTKSKNNTISQELDKVLNYIQNN